MKTQVMIEYGFKDINGNLWCDAWVDDYNRQTEYIKSINPLNTEKLNFYLDQRHRTYVLHMELSGNKAAQ